MFLNLLQEGNKRLFLELSVKAAMTNDIFSTEESELIKAYCREMNIPEEIPAAEEPLDNFLNNLSSHADSVEKKIVVLETLGLVRADGLYDEKERAFMEKLAAGLGINACVLDQLNSLLEIYSAVCKELRNAVCK